MNTLHFSTEINATAQKVWDVLWNDDTYRQWTSVFCEGSYMKGDLVQGGRIHFLSPDKGGMFSTVERLEPTVAMWFKHEGEIKNGEEMPRDEASESWSGAREQYELIPIPEGILLKVMMDITPDHEEYFNGVFPKALEKVKELSENQGI